MDFSRALSPAAAAIAGPLLPGITGPDAGLRLARLAAVLSNRGLRHDAALIGLHVVNHFPHDEAAVVVARSVIARGVPSWHVPMLLDEARAGAYARRLAAAVRPGMVVLDIGTGSGLLAMLAARAGAELVVACEQHPGLAAIAEENVRRNGLADRVRVIAKRSTALDVGVDLPRRADLMVSEIVDNRIIGEGVLEAVQDARERLLTREAIAIPESGSVIVAAGEAGIEPPLVPRIADIDVSAIDHVRPFLKVDRGKSIELATEPVALCTFDLSGRRVAGRGTAGATLTARRDADAAWVLQWMSLDLGGGIELSGGPGSPVTAWPIFCVRGAGPLQLRQGDAIHVQAEYSGTNLLTWIDAPTRLHRYPDEASYRQIQQAGNERKIARVWTTEANVAAIARYAGERIGDVRSVLCHGARNGTELRWFEALLPGHPQVLGTDIATTASSFARMLEWDFHELKPEWEGAWDLVYSNSWDHARDPERAFRAWLRSLSERGLLILEHSERHEPHRVSALDPFGATLAALRSMLDAIEPSRFGVLDVRPLPEAGRSMIVAGRRSAR